MHREGHLGAALLCFAPVGFVAAAVGGPTALLVGGGVAAGLAMVPDVDLRVPFVSHRGPTHTAWFATLLGAAGALTGGLLGFESGLLAALGLALLLGLTAFLSVASHIAADALTPMGVRPFTPWDETHYTWDVTRAANPVANYLLLAVGSVAAGGLGWLGLLLYRAV